MNGNISEAERVDAKLRATFLAPLILSEAAKSEPNEYAQEILGHYYDVGLACDQDSEKAFKWCLVAADAGLSSAQVYIGNAFYVSGTETDIAKAIHYFKLAAAKGHPEGQFMLGYFYNIGLGIEQDYTEAFRLYSLAADFGHNGAQMNLGIWYESGEHVVEQSNAEALRYFQLAAVTGEYYDRGDVIPRNAEKMVECCRAAAEKGYTAAEYMYGCLFYEGDGVEKSLAEAKKWWLLGAKKKDEDAVKALMHRLGMTPDDICDALGIAMR